MGDWSHDALADDLAAHLRGYARPAMIWTDMQLGPAGSPRPDVYAIEPTYTRMAATAFEVKVSRSDFLNDVQAGKALGYLKFATALIFAAPKGMLRKSEIPDGCGLIERGDQGWRYAKRATVHPLDTLPRDAWMKLLIDGRERDQGAGKEIRARQANEWVQHERARKMLGEDLGRLLADRDNAARSLRRELERLQDDTSYTQRQIREREEQVLRAARYEAEQVRDEVRRLAGELGLPQDARAHQVVEALRGLAPSAHTERNRRMARELIWAASRLRSLVDDLNEKPDDAECFETESARWQTRLG